MTKLRNLFTATLPSPLGTLKVMWNDDGLHCVEFADAEARLESANRNWPPAETPAGPVNKTPYPAAFERYWGGDLTAFDDFALVYDGTPFQLSVWEELRKIEPGTTSTYGDLAKAVGQPGASRAVGSANHNNPLGIVIPCHRVINSDGSLGGYGGGVERKHWLLAHEGAILL